MSAFAYHGSLFRNGGYVFDGSQNFIRKKIILRLSYAAGTLYHWMDGKTTDEQLIEKYNSMHGSSLTLTDLERFVRSMKKRKIPFGRLNGCLVSQASSYYRQWRLKRFDREKVRRPFFSGICYKESPRGLSAELKRCFDTVDGRRLDVLCGGLKEIRGILVPHSNLELSGSCAAWAYKALSRIPMPDTFVILGADHNNDILSHSIVLKDFLTPLGVVPADVDFGRRLAANCPFDILQGRLAHITEHSIEIQIPFLQYTYRNSRKRFRIVPVMCAGSASGLEIAQFVRAVRETCRQTRKRVFFIASTDFVHAKWKSPFLHARNKAMIECIRKADAAEFDRRFSVREYRFCSKTPITTLLRLLDPSQGKILRYSWTSNAEVFSRSAKLSNYDQDTDIGYASIVFY